METNELTSKIIGSAIEVHKELGPGLLESIYEGGLCHELSIRGLTYESQKNLPVVYKGKKLGSGYRIDLLVENRIIVELKACESIEPIHKAQILTYLKITNLNVVLILNFNTQVMRDGITRVVNEFKESSAEGG